MNLLQISYDKSFWDADAPETTLERQKEYFRVMKEQEESSKMVIMVLNISKKYLMPLYMDDLDIIPLNTTKSLFLFNFMQTFYQIVKKYEIDTISPQSIFEDGMLSLFMSKMLKRSIVAQVHMDFLNEAYYQELGGINKIRILFAKKSLRYYDRVRVVSTRIKEKLVKFELADKDKIFVIPVYVPMKEMKVEKPKASTYKVLFVGRFVYPKNLLLWLDVAKEIKKQIDAARFVLVGDGEDYQKIIDYAKTVGIYESCEFVGSKNNNEVAQYFYESDLFLLTSKYEGFGRVIVESYLNKTPVVSTDVAGPSDIIINGETGYICDVDDRACLVEKSVDILENKEKALTFSENGYVYVKNKFENQKLIRQWIQILSGKDFE